MGKLNVVEIFDSIQGEGIDAGRYATFVRLAGCNLSCSFCDTDFSHGRLMSVRDIVKKCSPNVVITGGEPLAQNIYPLVREFWQTHRVSLETNGTFEITDENRIFFSTISMSPKVPREKCKLDRCTSLKILFPYQNGATAEDYDSFHAQYKSLQVIDPMIEGAPILSSYRIRQAIDEIKRLNELGMTAWRLGIQLHKLIGVQ